MDQGDEQNESHITVGGSLTVFILVALECLIPLCASHRGV